MIRTLQINASFDDEAALRWVKPTEVQGETFSLVIPKIGYGSPIELVVDSVGNIIGWQPMPMEPFNEIALGDG